LSSVVLCCYSPIHPVSTSVSLAPSPALSSSDFPALTADLKANPDPSVAPEKAAESIAQAKVDKRAAQRAAAAERAAERQRVAQEKTAAKAAEKERIAQEKIVERGRLKAEQEKAAAEKVEKDQAEGEKLARLKAEKAKLEKEKAEKEKILKEHTASLAAERERVALAKKAAKLAKEVELATPDHPPKLPSKLSLAAEPVPMLSKMPKKYKPTKTIRIAKEDPSVDSALTSAVDTSYLPELQTNATDTGSSESRSFSPDGISPSEPTSIEELLAQIDVQCPYMDVAHHPIFDQTKINPAAKMPLEYGPLVHALSALSVGGGSFANSMPSGSIDNAVSSFQQLLETLTQTISDLLRLLPRTTWDDSSSFDGVLRDMLKGDDFLDDGNEEGNSKEDEVAALTMALERRARWMEVQLSKLEELHRDINMAAVRAVLSFNDNGWDAHGFMPKVGNTLQRFDNLGLVKDEGGVRAMTADELEKKLVVAKEAAVFAEGEVREMVDRLQALRPEDEEEYY
jgi:CCR4-NOT transcription complex subunit 4